MVDEIMYAISAILNIDFNAVYLLKMLPMNRSESIRYFRYFVSRLGTNATLRYLILESDCEVKTVMEQSYGVGQGPYRIVEPFPNKKFRFIN